MQWQLVDESTPRDGSLILVTREPYDGKRPLHLVKWGKGHHKSFGWVVHGTRKHLRYSPTHWASTPCFDLVDHP